ncbi:MAG: EAL domain-containing protein, partial [Deltaproteobacteria bacterium]
LEKERDSSRRSKVLKDIIRKKAIRTLYQPIVDLWNKEIIGYEALSRGPTNEFEDPDYLFKIASEADAIWRLERLCRLQAFKGACQLQDGKLLFVNVEPHAIYDPKFRSSETLSQMAESGLTPERVVIELTEHTAMMDFPEFRQTLQLFKALGFKVAIDDMGSGYSSLQSIAELCPDFIKMDMSLTRNLHLDPIKQELVSTIARFSEKIGMTIIIEGVETAAELEALKKLGIRFAQGFYFAFPGNPFPEVDPAKF